MSLISFETVEIEKQHGEVGAAAGARAERGFQLLHEGTAVGNARERVLPRQRGNARVGSVELVGEAHVDGQDQHCGA